jgi:RNase P/RNase MRP subunit POP5
MTAPKEITRQELIAAIRRSVSDKDQWERMAPWLTVFEQSGGILRCAHTGQNEAIELLTSIERAGGARVKITTLGTSGTIKKAKERYLNKKN